MGVHCWKRWTRLRLAMMEILEVLAMMETLERPAAGTKSTMGLARVVTTAIKTAQCLATGPFAALSAHWIRCTHSLPWRRAD